MTGFAGETGHTSPVALKGNPNQTKVTIVSKSSLVNPWVYVEVSNRSLSGSHKKQGWLKNSGIVEKPTPAWSHRKTVAAGLADGLTAKTPFCAAAWRLLLLALVQTLSFYKAREGPQENLPRPCFRSVWPLVYFLNLKTFPLPPGKNDSIQSKLLYIMGSCLLPIHLLPSPLPALCQLWREAPLCLLQVVLPVVRNFLSHLAPEQQVDPETKAVAEKDAYGSNSHPPPLLFLNLPCLQLLHGITSWSDFLSDSIYFLFQEEVSNPEDPCHHFCQITMYRCPSTYNGATSHSIYHCRFADWKCHK